MSYMLTKKFIKTFLIALVRLYL